jgi:Transposase DDE domain
MYWLGQPPGQSQYEWLGSRPADGSVLTDQRLFGLQTEHLAVDGCSTKAPCGGAVGSPVDRGKQGLKRSIVTDAGGVPLGAVPAAANRRDDGLLAATLDSVAGLGLLPARPVVHLDAGYDYQTCRRVLHQPGMAGQIATRACRHRSRPPPLAGGAPHAWASSASAASTSGKGSTAKAPNRRG